MRLIRPPGYPAADALWTTYPVWGLISELLGSVPEIIGFGPAKFATVAVDVVRPVHVRSLERSSAEIDRSYDLVCEREIRGVGTKSVAPPRRRLRLLLLDTCGAEGSIALADTGLPAPIVEMAALEGRTSSERLMPELRRMISARDWRLGEIAAVGVVAGPGSFTGVRVGVAAAKGLCEAAAVPLVMISRLAVLAHKVAGVGERTHAFQEAGRGEFFYGRFEPGEAPVEALIGREAALEVATRGVVVVCEEGVRAALLELNPVLTTPPSAADALPLVAMRVREGRFDDVAASDANYLRRTDLEALARLQQRASGA